MANNLITDTNTTIRSAAWHEGIEVVTAPIFIQFLFFSSFLDTFDTLDQIELDFSSVSSRARQIYQEELSPSDDFSYLSFQV
jgi:hypothetical protein